MPSPFGVNTVLASDAAPSVCEIETVAELVAVRPPVADGGQPQLVDAVRKREAVERHPVSACATPGRPLECRDLRAGRVGDGDPDVGVCAEVVGERRRVEGAVAVGRDHRRIDRRADDLELGARLGADGAGLRV